MQHRTGGRLARALVRLTLRCSTKINLSTLGGQVRGLNVKRFVSCMNKLSTIIKKLEKHYGIPEPPLADPLQIIIWESIGYLVEDDRRALAFEELRKKVGFSPDRILAAPIEQLIA